MFLHVLCFNSNWVILDSYHSLITCLIIFFNTSYIFFPTLCRMWLCQNSAYSAISACFSLLLKGAIWIQWSMKNTTIKQACTLFILPSTLQIYLVDYFNQWYFDKIAQFWTVIPLKQRWLLFFGRRRDGTLPK